MSAAESVQEPLASTTANPDRKAASVAHSGPQLSKGTVGAIAELLACADLMSLGYHVFRAESPHCPFDLIAYANGTSLRVEVKSLRVPQSQTVAPSFAWPVNDEWDLLVVAGHGKVFKFRPPATRDDAMTEIRAAFGYPQKRTELAPCGSLAAYSRHKTRREDCDECSQAASHYMRAYRIDRKAKANG